jgi:hypothetical protein
MESSDRAADDWLVWAPRQHHALIRLAYIFQEAASVVLSRTT